MYNPTSPAECPAAQARGRDEQSESSSMTLAAISVSSKLAEVWVEMPRFCFAQFEAVMAPQKQGDEAKFNMVISKLGRDAIQQVSDLVTSPPAENRYNLKRKTYSVEKKEEEVIIAQNGANQASTSHMEFRLEVLGIIVTVMSVIICLACVVTVYKVCVNKTKRLLRSEFCTSRNASAICAIPQQTHSHNGCGV